MFFSYILEYNRYANVLGIMVIFVLAWLFSSRRKNINNKLIAKAFALQVLFGILMIRVPFIEQHVVLPISNGVRSLFGFAREGAYFLFGNLITIDMNSWGSVFAFHTLPIIVFFAALTSLLFHFGIIQFFVSLLNRALRPLLGTSGPETLCAAANSFLGQTEAPLLIKNYLGAMTKSEMFVVMVSGMATVSGSIMAVYYSLGVPMQHMLTASIMAIPGSILMAKILIPEELTTVPNDAVVFEKTKGNVFEAIFQGTSSGVALAVNVGAMLLVFISLLPLVNTLLSFLGCMLNYPLSMIGVTLPLLSLDYIFGWLFAPFAYFLGFAGDELMPAARVLGTKVAVNEFVAFSQMLKMNFSERTVALLTYAVCGFSNFSCIGIQVGGIGALVPERRKWLTELGIRAVFASSMVNILSACIIGLLI
jgi:concentrative nucleoside transporter, CNT family